MDLETLTRWTHRARWCVPVLVALGLACGSDQTPAGPEPDPDPVPQPVLKIRPEGAELLPGETVDLRAELVLPGDSSGTPASPAWISLSPSIAAVDGGGIVEGLSPGIATIRASLGTSLDDIQVRVIAPPIVRAFPGAEGWGAMALSGCRDKPIEIMRVTTLDDSGPGSLREAIDSSSSSKMTIVLFDVAGYSILSSPIGIRYGCLYLAGQTAPGGGFAIIAPDITGLFLKGADLSDVALRYLRLRGGTAFPGQITSGQGLIIGAGQNVIVDHLSFSWATDQLLIIYGYKNGWGPVTDVTVQRTLLSEPLAVSPVCYSTKGDVEIDGDPEGIPRWYEVERVSLHHNAAIHCSHRAPMISSKDAEVISNVVYNWSVAAMHTEGRKPFVDYVSNYFRAGPMTHFESAREISHKFEFNQPGGWHGLEPDNYVLIGPDFTTWDGRSGPGLYLEGNVGPSDAEDQWGMTSKYPGDGDRYPDSVYSVVEYGSSGGMPEAVDGIRLRRDSRLPQPEVPVTVSEAAAAWAMLVEGGDVGASRRVDCTGAWVGSQDAVDARVLQEAVTGTGRASPSEITHPSDVGGFPELNPGEPCTDADGDGMPDAFETRYGFDPEDPSDMAGDPDHDGFKNIEEFVNGTHPREPS